MTTILPERFWSKVAVGNANECWPWIASCDSKGYGHIWMNGRLELSHRLVVGAKPGEYALHSCDNPPCCNPHHLRIGTSKENTADAFQRGRRIPCRGEQNGRAKINESIVRQIKSLLGTDSQSAIARNLNLPRHIVSDIAQGRSWSHV